MNDAPETSTPEPDAASDAAARATAARLPVVLQVLPSLDVGGGGVERRAIDVAEALVLAGKTAIVASAGGRQVVELERKKESDSLAKLEVLQGKMEQLG